MQNQYPNLSSPLKIRGLEFPNRIVMPPMVIWQSGKDAMVTDAHVDHYDQTAGPGLVIVEAACVSSNGRLAATQIGIFDDAHIPGLTRLAETIRSHGAVAGIQIHHAGAQSTLETNWGQSPVVVSLTRTTPESALELDEKGIRQIIQAFADAAERAVRAGFQVIEIHGAHGYLGSQFLSPRYNYRKDQWGGTLENRARFLVEVTGAVKKRLNSIDSDAVISCRLGVADQQLPIAEGIEAAHLLTEAGVELLHISNAGGMPKSPEGERLPGTDDGFSALFNLAFQTKAALADAWAAEAAALAASADIAGAEAVPAAAAPPPPVISWVPVIGVGGIKTPGEAETALTREEPVDLVAVGRSLLADPAWAAKALQGRITDISFCIDCKPRCFWFSDPSKCPARKAIAAGKYPAA